MKTRILISIVCFVLCLVPFANATIYVDGIALTVSSLTISDASYNNSDIRLTGESEIYIYSNGFDVGLHPIEAFDNTSVNIISNAPVLVLYSLMDFFWAYEDIQISSPLYSNVELLRQFGPKTYWDIATVYSPDNAVINVFVPEPATIALFGIAVPIILRRKRQS